MNCLVNSFADEPTECEENLQSIENIEFNFYSY